MEQNEECLRDFAGTFDGLSPDATLRGWVVALPITNNNYVRVSFFVGDEKIGTCIADLPRPDLIENAGINVPCAFEYHICLLDRLVLEQSASDAVITARVEALEGLVVIQGDRLMASDLYHDFARQSRELEGARRKIAESELFDSVYYSTQIRQDGSPSQLMEHYVYFGERQGMRPSKQFDPVFYRRLNSDLDAVGSLLSHYIEYGSGEGRYPTLESLRAHGVEVESTDLFDCEIFYSHNRERLLPELSPIEQHLGGLWRRSSRVNDYFDDLFYSSIYRDLDGLPPLVHYCRIGRKESRYPNKGIFDADRDAIAPYFDSEYYLSLNPEIDNNGDPVEHYLAIGRYEGLSPRRDFDPDYYTEAHSDIAQANMEPFGHFVQYGKAEGRNGTFSLAKWLKPGKRRLDPSRPTYIVVSHEASRTGAPLVALELCKHLSRIANVVSVINKTGELTDEFADVSIAVLVGSADHVDARYLLKETIYRWQVCAAVLNSAESVQWSIGCLEAGVPSVALVHEFAEYSLPPGKIATIVANCDRVIVPANIIQRSLAKELIKHKNNEPNSVVVAHQGRLVFPPTSKETNDLDWSDLQTFLKIDPAGNTLMVLGAGMVQPRKGVDYFIQIAAAVGARSEQVRFIWVGDGYYPDSDIGYGIWLREQIKRQNLDDMVYFLPAQSNLDVLFEHCDIFLLPSRLDPFPNVAIDAMAAGRKVVCFQNATGIAELIESGKAEGAVVPYADVEAAAVAILDQLRLGAESFSNRLLIEQHFDFDTYTQQIVHEIGSAIDARKRVEEIAATIMKSNTFDVSFYAGRPLNRRGQMKMVTSYVAMGTKALSQYSPRAGFNEGLYWLQHPDAVRDRPALAYAIATGDRSPTTHRCIMLSDQREAFTSPDDSKALRKALHIHLHYTDLAQTILRRLSFMDEPLDLYISTTSEKKASELRYMFSEMGQSRIEVIVFPNRGRDMGPFVSLLPRILAEGYDLVGHVHGKKSHAVNPLTGGGWREYLLNHMLGNAASMNTIAAAFAASPLLGLIFAEDRHVVGWSDNLEVAKSMAHRISPKMKLPLFPYFPLGAMFWARPAALSKLVSLDIHELCPPEPLPHDGTALHAVERMLPAIAEEAGFEWATVYRASQTWG